MRKVTIQDNVAISGGGNGILVDPFGSVLDQSTVVIAEDIAIFTNQANAAIALDPQAVINGVDVDETELLNPRSHFHPSPAAFI